MNTFRHLVYLVLDELKLQSDDSSFTEDHIIYVLSKYRMFLLKQRYSDIKKTISESNYQTVCLPLENSINIENTTCTKDFYLKQSKDKIPFASNLGNIKVYYGNFLTSNISYINKERFKYVGYNKYLSKIIYSTITSDNFLYLKSFTDNLNTITEVKVNAIFNDIIAASELECNKECDILDRYFPIEDGLVPPLIELTVKELSGAIYRPKDDINNAKDDLDNVKTK